VNPFNQLTIQPINRLTGQPAHRPTGRTASLGFWDDYAPWYEQWLCHNKYHNGILQCITTLAKPGCKVLDIGAGSGVLSLPLSEVGCDVTALEPSFAMRKLLRQKALGRQVEGLHLEKRPWEEIPADCYRGYDLMIACNSLHFSSVGFAAALAKMFMHRPEAIFIATEFLTADSNGSHGPKVRNGGTIVDGIKIPLVKKDYALRYARIEKVRSSFVYHNTWEAISHWTVIKGRRLSGCEKRSIALQLEKKGDHFKLADDAYVGTYCWTRCEQRATRVFKVYGKPNHAIAQSIH
jgi:SAM-dependent methyltransferase